MDGAAAVSVEVGSEERRKLAAKVSRVSRGTPLPTVHGLEPVDGLKLWRTRVTSGVPLDLKGLAMHKQEPCWSQYFSCAKAAKGPVGLQMEALLILKQVEQHYASAVMDRVKNVVRRLGVVI